MRRASKEYYPELHLELSRYVDLARKGARFNLGPNILRFVDRTTLSLAELETVDKVLAVELEAAKEKALRDRREGRGPRMLEVNF